MKTFNIRDDEIKRNGLVKGYILTRYQMMLIVCKSPVVDLINILRIAKEKSFHSIKRMYVST